MNTARSRAFVYVRRSQDRDDRQVLSIDGQLVALKKLADDGDFASKYLTAEEQTARKPGRPIFNDMMDRIEKREARYIITWNINRLARNPVDGGRVIWAMETGDLLAIITPGRRYTCASKEDLFLLSIEFGMAKMYSDDIRAGVRRGYAAKYERGEYPAYAPVGYLNGKVGHNRNIVPDPMKAPLILQIFQAAASGEHTLDSLHRYANSIGLTSRKGNSFSKSTLFDLMKNRIYAGVYFHGGAYHQGSYIPIISIELFDEAQIGLGFKKARSNTHDKGEFGYKGILICGYCGYSITAEKKFKELSNGAIAEYVYYHCTRKNMTRAKCIEPAITETELARQLRDSITPYVISPTASKLILEILEGYHEEQVTTRNSMIPVWERDLTDIERRLKRLTEMRIDEEIDETVFRQHNLELIAKQQAARRQLSTGQSNASEWLELARTFFSGAVSLVDSYDQANDDEKRRILMLIGYNHTLTNKKTVFKARKPYDLLLNLDENKNWRARPDSNRRSPP